MTIESDIQSLPFLTEISLSTGTQRRKAMKLKSFIILDSNSHFSFLQKLRSFFSCLTKFRSRQWADRASWWGLKQVFFSVWGLWQPPETIEGKIKNTGSLKFTKAEALDILGTTVRERRILIYRKGCNLINWEHKWLLVRLMMHWKEKLW